MELREDELSFVIIATFSETFRSKNIFHNHKLCSKWFPLINSSSQSNKKPAKTFNWHLKLLPIATTYIQFKLRCSTDKSLSILNLWSPKHIILSYYIQKIKSIIMKYASRKFVRQNYYTGEHKSFSIFFVWINIDIVSKLLSGILNLLDTIKHIVACFYSSVFCWRREKKTKKLDWHVPSKFISLNRTFMCHIFLETLEKSVYFGRLFLFVFFVFFYP